MSEEREIKIASAVGHVGSLPEHLKDFAAFLAEFNGETPRGAALTAAAFLDDILAEVIAAFLIENKSATLLTKGFNAPLGALSSRIEACHALGLISGGEFNECNVVRKIRNEFAHRVHASFANDKIRDLCNSLTMQIPDPAGTTLDARAKFTTAAVALILLLNNRAAYVRQKRRTYEKWPY